MKLLKSLPVALLISVPFALPALAETKPPKKLQSRIAVVDVDRCVGETEDGLRAKAAIAKAKLRFDSELFAREQSLKQMEQQLQEMLAAHQQSGSATPDPKMQDLAMRYQRDLQDYQNLSKKAQNDLAAYEDQLFLPIERKIKSIFTRLAEQNNYDLIVDRRSMPVALKSDLDLTEQVIREYNWGAPGAATPTPSAPAGAEKKP